MRSWMDYDLDKSHNKKPFWQEAITYTVKAVIVGGIALSIMKCSGSDITNIDPYSKTPSTKHMPRP